MDGVGAGEAGACGVENDVREPKDLREHGRALQAFGELAGKEQSGLERSDAQISRGNDAGGADRKGTGSGKLRRLNAELKRPRKMEVNVGGTRKLLGKQAEQFPRPGASKCEADFEEAFFEERLKIFEEEWSWV